MLFFSLKAKPRLFPPFLLLLTEEITTDNKKIFKKMHNKRITVDYNKIKKLLWPSVGVKMQFQFTNNR